jgi:RimJ/RimL family protein N-acetyltransferase
MDLPFTPLQDGDVRLEPLAEIHREALRAACAADPDLWASLYSYSMVGEAFDESWERLMRDAASGTWQPYAVLWREEVVGISCYIAIDHGHESLEIGGTYYRPEARAGGVNPAAKRLLLARAFDGGADRVQFRVDATNARSRAAVTKLGATLEGVLRHDKIVWTGRRRDTAVFSILADEWRAVSAGLDARLAGLRQTSQVSGRG